MSGISTHVLDVALGRPVAGIAVKLLRWRSGSWIEVADQKTDADGRCRELLSPEVVTASVYRMIFDTGAYFALSIEPALYPDISITFCVHRPETGYHMPLLLSPNGYTTYRGS